MSPQELEQILAQTLDDRRLSRGERQALAGRLADAAPDDARRALFRHAAFDLARKALGDPNARELLDWLEDVNKVLLPPGEGSGAAPSSAAGAGDRVLEAFFSPGEACVRRIVALLAGARRSADVCVFTITDDRIASAILAAHRRGVAVRIVTDNEKAFDAGSDVARLAGAGVPTRVDRSPFHMHHKFALFDGRLLLTGSYNWTRGAADNNEENLIVSNDAGLVRDFAREFERLWTEVSTPA